MDLHQYQVFMLSKWSQSNNCSKISRSWLSLMILILSLVTTWSISILNIALKEPKISKWKNMDILAEIYINFHGSAQASFNPKQWAWEILFKSTLMEESNSICSSTCTDNINYPVIGLITFHTTFLETINKMSIILKFLDSTQAIKMIEKD